MEVCSAAEEISNMLNFGKDPTTTATRVTFF
jgi:hypothetical protein